MSDAADRLARSRAALVAAMRPEPASAPKARTQADAHHHQGSDHARAGLGERLRRAWEAHPAHLVLEIAGPLLARWSARRPWQLLALAALAGGALVYARPWRLVRSTGLALALLRASLRALGLPTLALSLFRLRRPGRARDSFAHAQRS